MINRVFIANTQENIAIKSFILNGRTSRIIKYLNRIIVRLRIPRASRSSSAFVGRVFPVVDRVDDTFLNRTRKDKEVFFEGVGRYDIVGNGGIDIHGVCVLHRNRARECQVIARRKTAGKSERAVKGRQ
jgi:hypothetical protein